jgi:type VI secretion system protein ImpA
MGNPLPNETAMELSVPLSRDQAPAHNELVSRRDRILQLLEGSRDLRLYVRLVEAEARLRGLPGFHAGFHLLDSALRTFWDEMHPTPPDRDDTRFQRMNALGVLRQSRLVWQLDKTVMFDAGGFDKEITLRTFYLATGRHLKTRRFPPSEGETVYEADSLQQIIARADKGKAVVAAHAALVASQGLLRGLGIFLAERSYESVRLGDLAADLDVFIEALAPFLSAKVSADPTDGPPAEGESATGDVGDEIEAEATDAIRSREEAMAVLDAVLGYYTVNAPSSPVAVALVRIRGLMYATFDRWIAEVAGSWPDVVSLSLTNVDLSGLIPTPPDHSGAPISPSAVTVAPQPALLSALEAIEEVRAALAGNEAVSEAAAAEIRRLGAALEAAQAAVGAVSDVAGTERIRDRPGVRRALQRLAVFFRTAEPSSPAYLCFEKLIDLVDRGFLDILRRVAPQGVSSAALVLTRREGGG